MKMQFLQVKKINNIFNSNSKMCILCILEFLFCVKFRFKLKCYEMGWGGEGWGKHCPNPRLCIKWTTTAWLIKYQKLGVNFRFYSIFDAEPSRSFFAKTSARPPITPLHYSTATNFHQQIPLYFCSKKNHNLN